MLEPGERTPAPRVVSGQAAGGGAYGGGGAAGRHLRQPGHHGELLPEPERAGQGKAQGPVTPVQEVMATGGMCACVCVT